jgi:chitodextrinase
MDRSIQGFRVRLAKAAALLVFVSSAAPQALAQLLPPLPLPGGRLIVTMTSPGSGSTVANTVAVSASVSIVGSLTVSSVQFKLDGANLGAPDTSVPYSVSWNTAAASNGSHTLTAVARDILGAQFTSAPVTVTVFNAPPPPPPPPADTTPPSVPTGLTASAVSSSQINLSWAASSDNVGVSGYRIYRGGTQIATTTATFYTNTGLSPSTTYSYAVAAFDAAGNLSAQSSPASATTPAAPDTTPPTVSITAPSNGATVKGTVTVTASASDNVGVVGVQFLLDDGINGSAEATTAPYSVSWNTATASDGSHTITAVARDAAGNRTKSAPVTVTVANNAPPPSTRFEDTDPSVVYSGPGWRPDVYAALSNGGATASDQAGAQATFTFTGTSVSWIGGRWIEEGIARVFLDGSFVTEVDMYSKTKEVQVPLFTALDLANTSHRLTIEVTGQKNVASKLAFVLVDAFDVPAVTISRLQDTDPAVVFSGAGWVQGVTGDEWSGGTAAGSLTPGDRATFTFTGTGVRWLGELGPDNGGIARVFLDGVFMKEVGTYAPSPDPAHQNVFQAEHFKATGLADTSHTLTIEVTGRQNPAARTAIVVVDAFDVITSGRRRQETDPAITYTAGWLQGNRDHPYSEGTAAVSTIPGDRATFTFTGTSVSWIGYRGPQAGIARVILDGTVVADSLDMFIPSPSEGSQEAVFTIPGLAAVNHTLTIEVTGSKNPASLGLSIVVDAFDVRP